MSLKFWYVGLLSISTLLSCEKLVLTKENKKDIIKKSLEDLKFTEVEQPPLFSSCASKSEPELDQCFQQTITKLIFEYLNQKTIIVKNEIKDTIWVPLLITKDGDIKTSNLQIPLSIYKELPELKQHLEKSIEALPKIKAAHTRGTPVNSLYKLPLVLHFD